MSHPYRVFISYSREDAAIADRVAQMLKDSGLVPLWDPQIQPGDRFTDKIKALISHSHLFLPLVTERSHARPWVHQETGFAIALGIPVLPLAIDGVPGAMSADLQALQVSADLSDLRDGLDASDIDRLVEEGVSRPTSLIEVAGWPEQRADCVAKLASKVMRLGGAARVRQRGTYSTFSVPIAAPEDPIWQERDGDNRRSEYFHDLQSKERKELGRHARQAGCDLIINPQLRLDLRGIRGTRARLEELLSFLRSDEAARTRVAIPKRGQPRNLTVLGDWWTAESMVPGPGGYRQTVFNWHGPSALKAAQDFDREFEVLSAGVPEGESKQRAENVIEEAIKNLGDPDALHEEVSDG